MDAEAVKQARKNVQSLKPVENMAIVEVGWSCKLVMPHKDAMTLMGALVHAEQLVDQHCATAAIKPLDSNKVQVSILSTEDYQLYKMAQLLKVPYSELQEYLKEAA